MDFFENMPDLDISLLTKSKPDTTAVAEITQVSDTQNNTATITDVASTDTKKNKLVKDTSVNQTTAKNPFVSDEPEEVEEVEEPDKPETFNTQTGAEESPIKLIASFLKEKGAIEFSDEDFSDNDEFIAEQVNKTIEKRSNEGIQVYKDTLPEAIKDLIENYEEGVPLGQLLEYEQKSFELSTITAEKVKEDSKLQEDLVESYMLNTGWSKEETDERIKELQDAGIMEKEAVRALTKLKQLEISNKESLIRQSQEKKKIETAKYQAQVEQLNNTIKGKKEFFDGLPTSDIEKKQVFDAITKYDKTGRNKITQYLSDPETYIKTAYFLEILKGDISKLRKVATTQAINTTKKTLDTPVKTESRFNSTDLSLIKRFLKTKP